MSSWLTSESQTRNPLLLRALIVLMSHGLGHPRGIHCLPELFVYRLFDCQPFIFNVSKWVAPLTLCVNWRGCIHMAAFLIFVLHVKWSFLWERKRVRTQNLCKWWQKIATEARSKNSVFLVHRPLVWSECFSSCLCQICIHLPAEWRHSEMQNSKSSGIFLRSMAFLPSAERKTNKV